MLCGVSFPVIFVLFRLAPELNIFSGIMLLCCDFLPACRAGDVIGSAFLFITLLGSPAARAVPARVMSSVSAVCLLAARRCPFIVIRFAPPRFASRRLVFPPRLSCRGTGSRRGLLACLDGVMPTAGAYRALDVMPWTWSIYRASVILPVLLLRMR